MNCRHCAAPLDRVCLDLGSAPPSNAYLSDSALRAPEVWYPLRLLVCERCWLVQTEDHAGREALFGDDYAYFSSFSTSWLAHAETKLVHCLRGEVWDVAVDLRRGSPTFLRWHAEPLSDENGVALLIPAGFAHGLQTLADDVDMLYCHSVAYAAESEGGIHPLEPRLAIDWPMTIALLSPRDDGHAWLDGSFEGIAV